jgi:hypothetical protein
MLQEQVMVPNHGWAGQDWSGSYDIESIMHYQGWGFGLRGKDTLIPVPPNTWPEFGVEPSELDVESICKIQSDECSIDMKVWKEKGDAQLHGRSFGRLA